MINALKHRILNFESYKEGMELKLNEIEGNVDVHEHHINHINASATNVTEINVAMKLRLKNIDKKLSEYESSQHGVNIFKFLFIAGFWCRSVFVFKGNNPSKYINEIECKIQTYQRQR